MDQRKPSDAYYRGLVRASRAYGSCYLHAGLPRTWTSPETGITYTITSYGRSWQAGGHKSKAYAHKDGKIVRSKDL